MVVVNYILRLALFGVLILGLAAYCHPAPAGGHTDYFGGSAEGFYENRINPIPVDTLEDRYEIEATKTSENPDDIPMHIHVRESDTHYADVEFHNELTLTVNTRERINFIRPDGLIVSVVFRLGDGDNPDVFSVIPPKGFIAIPSEISVEEGDTAVIEIHEALIG